MFYIESCHFLSCKGHEGNNNKISDQYFFTENGTDQVIFVGGELGLLTQEGRE